MIIAGYAGVGKSEFCKAHVNDAIDLICMPFKYDNFYEVSNGLNESEDIKANSKLNLREHWEMYYYWVLKYLNRYCPEKYIIIPTIKSVLQLLKSDGIPYTVVYPSEDCKEEYRERFIKRGNAQAFLDVFIEGWNVMRNGLNELGGNVIELQAGQFLSDVIKVKDYPDIEYTVRQLSSFKHSLEWENYRQKNVKKRMKDDWRESAKKYYMNLSINNSFRRMNRTSSELFHITNQDLSENDTEIKVKNLEEVFELIARVIEDVDLNFLEYDSEGNHLRFTNTLSLGDTDLRRQMARCLDENNYLDVRYNSSIVELNYLDIRNMTFKEIENRYLKNFIDIIVGVLRKGNCYWNYVVSSEISDDKLKQMICYVYKQNLLNAYVYREGKNASDVLAGMLYFVSIMEDDIIDDYVCVSSKEQLRCLLEDVDFDSCLYKPEFCLLSIDYKNDEPKFKTKTYSTSQLRAIKAFLGEVENF